MAASLDLQRFVQGYMDGQDRAPGYGVPATTDIQQPGGGQNVDGGVQKLYPQTPGDVVDRDHQGPAMRRSANDLGWRPQDRFEAKAYRETIQLQSIDAGATFTVDPNLCVNFWLDCIGDVTIAITDPEDLPDLDPSAPTPSHAELATVFVSRSNGAVIKWPSDWLWSSDIRGGQVGSNNPFSPAAQDGQIDAYTIMRIPNRAVLCFFLGAKFS